MATKMIQSAAKRQRKAMTLLYEANKQKIFYLAECLLLDKVQAASAAAWVFKNIWDSSDISAIATEEEFTQLAVRKVVDYCKTRILKENPKSFKISKNCNFLYLGEGTVSNGENTVSEILAQLPELHRFIFVLHTVGGCKPEQIAKLLKSDSKSIECAIKAEKSNMESLICPQSKNELSYELILNKICEDEAGREVPSTIDEQAMAVIDLIATPIEKKRKKTIGIAGAIAVGLCACIGIGIAVISSIGSGNTTSGTNGENTSNTGSETYTPEVLDEELTYYADFEIEKYGTITVLLEQESAPITCANFVELANSGFYDGLTFHLIKEDYIQGGDPNGNGTGGSEHKIVGEFSENGYKNDLSHTRGAISMARFSDYDSAKSQFFIVRKDRTDFDGKYAVFGYVTEGMEVVDAVCEGADANGNGYIDTEEQPVIHSVKIRTE